MKPASDTRKPYTGPTRALVIALDVGTTFSGVSYAILEPGEIPKIYGVTRFPGQEHVAGNSKIPSILYYDREGNVMYAGAEADNASITSQAEDESWIKAELFKLRLRPKAMKLNMNGMRLSPLPRHKTPVDVFGDFLRYLFHCTRSFIIDTHANGKALWQAIEHSIEFVLSHPNGWEGAQQTKMRRAAVYGGLIPDTDEGRARIRFVTEGEASLHACVQSGLAADVLSNPSSGFLVADAGGGTLDISSYAVRSTSPLVIEEIAPPDCIFAGSVFVSRRAREFLADKLKGSKYGSPDSIDHITKRFDETTKRLFRDKNDIQWVPFGSPLDKDLAVGIRGGSLKLTGAEVAELFEPSIQAAITSIKSQVVASQGMIKSVWLVGGFAASPWLFAQLQERLMPMKITVSRPDNQTSKAVADGALGFYSDHHVSARVSKFMYGVEYLREFDPNDPEHAARKERLCELPSGPKLLPDAFDCILARGVKVKESTVFTRKYCTELTNLSTLSVFEVEIWCYRGGDMIPPWILRHHEDYGTLCVVRADLSPLSGSAEPKSGRNGKTYWTIVFSVEIHFGLTEFRARIKWNDNGRTKYGPASIVYSESGHRADEDETDIYSEDDFGPSRSVSRAPSRPTSVAPSRTHSQDSVGSGTKTPQGLGRLDATYMDRSRSVSASQSTHSRSQQSYHTSQSQLSPSPQSQTQPQPPLPPPQPQSHHHHQQQYQQQATYTERTREFEQRERTVSSSASRASASITHLERDRKISTTSKLASYTSQSVRESEKERRTRDAAAERERAAAERDRAERERVVAERERLERERFEREREKSDRAERQRIERERIEREGAERERIEREIAEKERIEREIAEERAERERAEREQAEREERERIAAAEAAAATAAFTLPPPQKAKKGKTAAERLRIERETAAERQRIEREAAERERIERETAEKERIEREIAEQERIERETAEREKAEREQAERERAEREQAEQEERERIAAAEAAAAAAAPPPQKGKKSKTLKNTSKQNSPIDFADTTVGKSPGQLATTLNSVWGSQSKAVTPAPSPFPSSARSFGPESSKPTPRELEPTTPALGEAPNMFFADQPPHEALAVSEGLALDVSQPQVFFNPEDPLAGHTPADTVPPEQLIGSETFGEGAATTQTTFEQTFEASETKETFESVEVNETATTGAFDAFGASDGSTAQADGAQTTDEWGIGGWGVSSATTSIKETTENVTAAAKSFSFGFGSGGGTTSLSMPKKGGLSSAWGSMTGGVNSLFGGGTKNEIELDPLSESTGAGGGMGEVFGLTGTEEQPLGSNALEAPAAGEPEAVAVPPPPEGATEPAPEPAPAAAPEEPPSAPEPSTTDNPTDPVAEEGEQEDGGFQGSKKTKRKKGKKK